VSELQFDRDATARLAAAARALARGADLESILDLLLRIAADESAASVAVVAGVDDDRARLHFLYGLGMEPADVEAVELSTADLADPIVAAAVERGLVDSPAGDGRVEGRLAERLGLARIRAIPLVVAHDGIDHAVGVLALGWLPAAPEAATPAAAAPPVTPLLEGVADLGAVAVERARLVATAAERAEWFERLAHLDPLTGLANRRTFDRVLELELARAGRQGSEVALLAFDVDSFRDANEQAGRGAGDDILRAVAAVLAEQVRLVDTVARIGGDEFVIVAPGSGGMAVATRIIDAIRALEPVAGVPVSVSAGISRFPRDATTGDAMVEAALAALAAARDAGRGAIAEATSAS
jgi:diguanylate cyclase (GGDEF)-like protein